MHTLNPPLPASAHLDSVAVGDIMTSDLVSCVVGASVRTVAALMVAHRIHAVFVFDVGEVDGEPTHTWGLVSDLDLVAAARLEHVERTAGEISVSPIVTVRPTDTLDRAAELMALHGISHLAVVEDSATGPAGVISSLDIARTLASPRISARDAAPVSTD